MAKFEAMERIQQQQKEHQQRQKQDQGESGQETSKARLCQTTQLPS